MDEYRVDGILVQAMWDYNVQAFTVSDGNSQHLDLYANYEKDSQGNYTYVGSTLYVYGDELRTGSGQAKTMAELQRMGMDHREFRVYVVEVCRSCGWNHLTMSYVLGRDGLPGRDAAARREAARE